MALLESGRAEEGAALLHLLNPVAKYVGNPGLYGGEPYVMAGDVYAHGEIPGRAGWTWYTGSAGWAVTTVLRSLLGLRPQGDRLVLLPCLPSGWNGYTLSLTLNGTPLRLCCRRGHPELTVDGAPALFIPLDGKPHEAVFGHGPV